MLQSTKTNENKLYEWIIKNLNSKVYVNMLYVPSDLNEGNKLFKIVKLKEGDKLLRFKILIDYLNFKKKLSPGLVPNPRMFNENDLEMHFVYFIEDLKTSNFKLKQEKDTIKKIEYVFEIPNTTNIFKKPTNFQSSSNRLGNLRSSHGRKFSSLRPYYGNERAGNSSNLSSIPLPIVDYQSIREVPSTVQTSQSFIQVQSPSTSQTQTIGPRTSRSRNTNSQQYGGINNQQFQIVNQQASLPNQQTAINSNQIIMQPADEHSDFQSLSRSQTTTSLQQFRSRRSNLNNQNTNLDITDINNRFLQLLNQLQMQAYHILEFNIRIKVQDRLVTNRDFTLNSGGLHIYYGDQQRTLTVLERHEPSMASMIRATGFSGIEIRKPAVIDGNVGQILKAFTCGILIKYNNRTNSLLVYRFSQARVFVTSHLHRNEKIQRSCGSAGQQPLEALCYPKCLYNSPLNYEDKTIVLKIASSKVMIEIQPLSIDKLAEEVQKTNRRQSNFTLNQQRVEQSSLNRNTRSNQDMSFNPTMS